MSRARPSLSTEKKPRRAKKKQRAIPRCPKCGGRNVIKSGYVQKEQRWKCKECAYQYTRPTPRGRPLWQKSLAVFLYYYGVPMRVIAEIFHIQPSTVVKWVQSYSEEEYLGMVKSGAASVMELEEMQKYLKKKGQNSAVLCIAIADADFKKSLGVTLHQRERE